MSLISRPISFSTPSTASSRFSISFLSSAPQIRALPPGAPQIRFLRERARVSDASYKRLNMENPQQAAQWPRDAEEIGRPLTERRMRYLIHHLHVEEMKRMEKLRTFTMPTLGFGDLIEVKYELSRSEQTYATFQGYCVALRKKRACSSFILKNTYDGVGVEQLFPIYNPRLLDVVSLKAAQLDPNQVKMDPRHKTRNYRHMWQYYIRAKQWKGNRYYWWKSPTKKGILPLEPKIRIELSHLRRRYAMQRASAGLPPYIFPGPYQITRRQTREVRAEMERRMLIYAWDDKRARKEKLRKQRLKERWTGFRIARVDHDKTPMKDRLPGYHTLNNTLK